MDTTNKLHSLSLWFSSNFGHCKILSRISLPPKESLGVICINGGINRSLFAWRYGGGVGGQFSIPCGDLRDSMSGRDSTFAFLLDGNIVHEVVDAESVRLCSTLPSFRGERFSYWLILRAFTFA